MAVTEQDIKTKPSRRQQILEALARQLEESPGERITTAGLARAVGVSEAALYRHFPSKAKMFEGLIEFIEETVFGLTNRILQDESSALLRIERIIVLVLGFAERNPGITRLLTGDVLIGETERLRTRISQFYERLETQLKQVLREGDLSGELHCGDRIPAMANMFIAFTDGKMQQFVRSSFKRSPVDMWPVQWQMLSKIFS